MRTALIRVSGHPRRWRRHAHSKDTPTDEAIRGLQRPNVRVTLRVQHPACLCVSLPLQPNKLRIPERQ